MNALTNEETVACLCCKNPMTVGTLLGGAHGASLRDQMCSNQCVEKYFRTIENFKVGDGAQLRLGSDVYPATIIAITKTQIIVQRDGYHKGLFLPCADGEILRFRLNKFGAWKNKSWRMHPGERRYYMDPCF